MKVAVLRKGVKKLSKFDNMYTQRVTMENIETDKPRYIYLNMTDDVKGKWENIITPGNVLNVPVVFGTNYINKYGQATLIRKVTENDSI
jgi:hypothetical protein